MRFALARYLTLIFDLRIEVSLQTLWSLLPNFDGPKPERRDVSAYRYGDRSEVPLILSSHLPFDPVLFDGTPIVFLVRSPWDVTVSNYFQRSRTQRIWAGALAEFVRDPELGIHGYVRYLNGWSPRLVSNGDLVLSYESLRENPIDGFSAVVSHLGIRLDPGRCASPSNMHRWRT